MRMARERLAALAARVGPSVDALARRPYLAWGVLFLILAVATGIMGLAVMEAVVHAKKVVQTPDLRGKSVEQALDLLSGLNLSLAKQGVEFNESLPSGAILKQTPVAGMKVREGKVIRVTVSSGGQVIFVPGLVDKPLAEAQNLLRLGGLSIGAVSEVYSQKLEAGWVLDQTPSSGTVSKKGQMVDLKVSKGPPPEGTLLMPDFRNQPLTRAMEWANAQNVRVNVTEEVNPNMVAGLILRQAPAPDGALDSPAEAAFVVAKSSLSVSNAKVIRYEVPVGSDEVQLRILLRDGKGERQVYQGKPAGGAIIEIPVAAEGEARARIMVNGILVEERSLP